MQIVAVASLPSDHLGLEGADGEHDASMASDLSELTGSATAARGGSEPTRSTNTLATSRGPQVHTNTCVRVSVQVFSVPDISCCWMGGAACSVQAAGSAGDDADGEGSACTAHVGRVWNGSSGCINLETHMSQPTTAHRSLGADAGCGDMALVGRCATLINFVPAFAAHFSALRTKPF